MTDPCDNPESLVDLAARALEAYRAGDAAAMPELVDRGTPVLWHVARAQGLDPEAAEDVVQTTWLRLVQNAESILDTRSTLKWLITTAKRESWALARRSQRVQPIDSLTLNDRPSLSATPEELSLTRAQGGRLWAHFRELPQRCQQLLRLVAFADKPDYQAVSEALGMPIGSIGPTRGRCLAKLRLALEADSSWEMTR